MRPLPLTLLAVVAAVPSAGAVHDVPPFRGGCSHVAVATPTQLTGVLYGAGFTESGASSVTLRCSVHVGNGVHNGGATVGTESPSPGPGATAAPPVTFSTDGTDVHFCGEVTIGDTTFYYDGEHWVTDSGAPCEEVATIGT